MTAKKSPRHSASPVADLIREVFAKRRAANPRYSVRAYAKMLGISHTSLNRVLRKELVLRPETERKLVAKLGLDPAKVREVVHALRLQEEEDPEILRLLRAQAPEAKASKVLPIVRIPPGSFGDDGLFQALLVLSYLALKAPTGEFDPVKVSEQVRLDLATVKRVFEVLAEAGFLERKSSRAYALLGKRVEFLSTEHSLPLKQVHLQALKLASRRISETRPSDRYSATETLAMPAEKLGQLQALCDDFIENVRVLADSSSQKADRIFLVAVHAIPWFSG